MSDVGRLAGVSTQTVSRYFTGQGYVSSETKGRIVAAIDQLGYTPNRSARSLRTARSGMVGVLSMGALNYGAAEILTGLSAAALESDITLAISQVDAPFDLSPMQSKARRILAQYLSLPVDGIVVSTPMPGVAALLDEVVSSRVPSVTVSDRPASLGASVGTRSHEAARLATEHLLALGHTRIAHIAGPGGRNEAFERERGYRDAMIEHGQDPVVFPGGTDWSGKTGFDAGSGVDPGLFTGIFAANDEIAMGFMCAAEARGVRAPADYSIVGVDDMPTAAYASPPLTSVRLGFRAVGTSALRILLQEIANGERGEHSVVDPDLIVRASTGPPAR
jgi:DNA-binding LacI/PurR family transcriptional regulator